MLRNRSRAVTSKQALMADHSSQPSPAQNYTKPIQSFFGSPRFRAFTMKGFPETGVLMSPTSILDTKPISPFGNSFSYSKSQSISPEFLQENKQSWTKAETKGIGLALIDPLNDETIQNCSTKSGSGKVLFGTKLRVQIPTLQTSTLSPIESPRSPADFGIKTRYSHISAIGSPNSSSQTKDSPGVLTACISMSDMEHSEEYTCVISHGPNPRTTRIFDNCIVESFYSLSDKSNSVSQNFLSFCYTCKKNLEQENDIYIYRGEKAFCSHECRHQEMLLDGVGNTEFDDAHRNCS
ncbi:hypothetical protein FEM48_Zijuj09G0041200 [Ziziphus jujuba var. spinosa]|uniref:protein MARD1-like n=2 Tax=Ziziphus jujuba TaxID=326968 RepID=A0A6P4AA20_ZIZJJ|nr:hypothetical protein FEM48_Zijuj09G0041200 [Ziziphus jujuba var. spinosa]